MAHVPEHTNSLFDLPVPNPNLTASDIDFMNRSNSNGINLGAGLNNSQFTNPQQTDRTLFDFAGQGGANIAAGLKGVGSIANALAAFRQLGLARDAFQANRALTNRNLANQARITNAQIEDRARRRARSNQALVGDTAAQEATVSDTLRRFGVSGEPV